MLASGIADQRNDLMALLRQETSAVHARLERKLTAFRPPLQRTRFAETLKRFLGFHEVWEPAIGALPVVGDFYGPRSRLALLREDLQRLGCAADEIEAIPRCREAADLARSRSAALGSLYVIEGATLGGQVIDRMVKAQRWAPAEGIAYFNPYGARTGRMWRDFKSWCEMQVGEAQHRVVADAARETFCLVESWVAS